VAGTTSRTSIVIRTYNEARYLPDLLKTVSQQQHAGCELETIIVDSGSIDSTLDIAEEHGCRIAHINKDEFTFGRSLNRGCEAATGDILVFASGHCVPTNKKWLREIIRPIRDGRAVYTYGRQVGNKKSKFSECQLFKKYYPETSKIPQKEFFINNANAALDRNTWNAYRFNEELTGLEDMELGKRLVKSGKKLAYVSAATVYHIHDESWHKVRARYEREAIALQTIMPEVHISPADFFRYFFSALFLDMGAAIQEKCLRRRLPEIVAFRWMQFWGSYRGNHEHRRLSKKMKEEYFFPK
jgi:rhamnosyltransferase